MLYGQGNVKFSAIGKLCAGLANRKALEEATVGFVLYIEMHIQTVLILFLHRESRPIEA